MISVGRFSVKQQLKIPENRLVAASSETATEAIGTVKKTLKRTIVHLETSTPKRIKEDSTQKKRTF